jgi:molybdopterin-containing oxidoreductase family iron-sulfur binding subunit
MQCSEPECLKVCPTNATQQQKDGVVYIDANKCIGCKYCMMACPYGARQPASIWRSYFPEEKPLTDFEKYARQQWISKHGEGTSTKCDFCKERVEEGLQPACVDACPAKARIFGDLDDPSSDVAMLIRTERGFQLNPEFGTDPSVYYLPAR